MHEAHAPIVVNVKRGQHCVLCSCGWVGPLRYESDPHASALLKDDEDWHDEQIAKGP